MRELVVYCPKCEADCEINIDERELIEDEELTGAIGECLKCGCHFCFDVTVEIKEKEIMGQ